MANYEKQVEQEAAYTIPISLYNCYRTVRHEKRGIATVFHAKRVECAIFHLLVNISGILHARPTYDIKIPNLW